MLGAITLNCDFLVLVGPTAAMRNPLLCIALAWLSGVVHGIAPTGNPTATFMQGRVNLPHAMYNKGYYVIGSFQAPLSLPQLALANTGC